VSDILSKSVQPLERDMGRQVRTSDLVATWPWPWPWPWLAPHKVKPHQFIFGLNIHHQPQSLVKFPPLGSKLSIVLRNFAYADTLTDGRTDGQTARNHNAAGGTTLSYRRGNKRACLAPISVCDKHRLAVTKGLMLGLGMVAFMDKSLQSFYLMTSDVLILT